MTVRLAVAGAFHTDFMAPAREKLQEALAGTAIQVGSPPAPFATPGCPPRQGPQATLLPKPTLPTVQAASRCLPPATLTAASPALPQEPRIPVISNVDAAPHADPDTIKAILAQQLTAPVQWETTLKTLLDKGLERSYEIGPNKVRPDQPRPAPPRPAGSSGAPPPVRRARDASAVGALLGTGRPRRCSRGFQGAVPQPTLAWGAHWALSPKCVGLPAPLHAWRYGELANRQQALVALTTLLKLPAPRRSLPAS